MSKRNERSGRKGISRLWGKNTFVFGFSLIIAVVLWTGVSMFQTKEEPMEFKDIKINIDATALEGKALEVFGTTDMTVDVTVKGKSYLVKDSSFANNITATVSLDSVEEPGKYPLPVKVAVNANVEIVSQSKDVVTLNIDKLVTRDVPVEVEVIELKDYKLDPEKYVLGEAVLSTDTVEVEGPSQEMARLDKVIATVELNEELTQTVENLKADLSFLWLYTTEETNLRFAEGTEVFVTIPVSEVLVDGPVSDVSEYTVKPKFINVPETFNYADLVYTVSPGTVRVAGVSTDGDDVSGKVIEVGPIDFTQLFDGEGAGLKRSFQLQPVNEGYVFEEEIAGFSVDLDMTRYRVLWKLVPVRIDKDKLPAGASVRETDVKSVQIVCSEDLWNRIDKLQKDDFYAEIRIPAEGLTSGSHQLPVDIRLPDDISYWVRNPDSYTVTVIVP